MEILKKLNANRSFLGMGGIKLDGKVLVTVRMYSNATTRRREKKSYSTHSICKTNDTNQKFMTFFIVAGCCLFRCCRLSVAAVVVVGVTSK